MKKRAETAERTCSLQRPSRRWSRTVEIGWNRAIDSCRAPRLPVKKLKLNELRESVLRSGRWSALLQMREGALGPVRWTSPVSQSAMMWRCAMAAAVATACAWVSALQPTEMQQSHRAAVASARHRPRFA